MKNEISTACEITLPGSDKGYINIILIVLSIDTFK